MTKGEKNPMYGKKHSEETKIKMSQAAKLRKREKASNWQGGKRINHNGYVEVLNRDHPRARQNGYVFEHILVAENKLGRNLKANEHVHHINENKQDNTPENLQVVDFREHARLHAPKRRKGKILKCIICGTEFYKKPSHIPKAKCCSRSCSAKYGSSLRKGVV